MAELDDVLGSALSFPLRLNGRGGLAVSKGVAAVEDSLRAILSNLRGANFYEPWLFPPSFVFNVVNDAYAVAEVYKEAIIDAEDRVDPATLRVAVRVGDDGEMAVAIDYTLKVDFTPRTLQFGFRELA